MARLYLTSRELDWISDITKEVIKDVVGQKIYYYAISEHKTQTHDVYDEAVKKVFDHPIEIEALVNVNDFDKTEISQFGVDKQYNLEVFLQYRDMVERGIEVTIGDYFSFSDVMYEITERQVTRNIYGLAEHADGVRIVGTRAREGAIEAILKGPTDLRYTDDDAEQNVFVQQRGQESNILGDTGDVRALQEKGVLDPPLTGPREVSEKGNGEVPTGHAFYDDED